MMGARYSYTIVRNHKSKPGVELPWVIVLRDFCLPGHKSITNDAEKVVEEVVQNLGNLPIIYYDTNGDLSELAHNNGKFERFGQWFNTLADALDYYDSLSKV